MNTEKSTVADDNPLDIMLQRDELQPVEKPQLLETNAEKLTLNDDWKLNLTSEEYAILDTFESTGFAELINPNDLTQNQFAWDYCYREFDIIHSQPTSKRDYDKAALQLYGYSCSQDLRMGNNITKLNYTALIPAVKYLLELPDWNHLRSISFDVLDTIDESGKHIAADVNVLLEKVIEVKDKLHTLLRTEFDKKPSDNLISTVLLGVLGCCPSYDSAVVEFLQNEKSLSGEFNAKSLRSIYNYCVESSFDGKGEDIRALAKESAKVPILSQKYPIFRVFDLYARGRKLAYSGIYPELSQENDWSRVTTFITREMNVNSELLEMAGGFMTKIYKQMGIQGVVKLIEQLGAGQINESEVFFALVPPNMYWDHKPRIESIMAYNYDPSSRAFWIKSPVDIDGDNYIDYDIFSNIHYGYVGKRIGISTDILNLHKHVGAYDSGDELSVQLGYELYDKYPTGFSTIEFRDYLVSHIDEFKDKNRTRYIDWSKDVTN